MKIAIVGGGSSYTPELVNELIIRSNTLPLTELYLTDINKERLQTVAAFCHKYAINHHAQFELNYSTDLKEALQGADFILLQIRVGGQEARHNDIKIGLKYNLVGQETTGVGGFAKAMRTIPEILDIASEIKQYASPDCWVINFTNPSGIITQAINDYTDLNVIGLCNIPIILLNQSAEILNLPLEKLSFDYVGLNHLGWLRHVYYQGKDQINKLVATMIENPEIYRAKNIPAADIGLLKSLQMVPSPYLQYFYFTNRIVTELKKKKFSRAEEVMEIDKKLMEIFKNNSGQKMPEELQERGGELYSRAAVNVINSIVNNTKEISIVNVENQGAIQFLNDGDVVEVQAIIDQTGAHPVTTGEIEPQLLGLIQQVKAYERLTVRAAVSKKYDEALWALNTNPLVTDLSIADQCLKEINQVFALNLK